ncbi:uncharacterized protein LOC134216226 [Armigeres subalbatus]|uniref:uncharacterized protein LOC134216226 n=1 Tax=Armigeres subalbatus TaxID=124917 RepID=UPI002ED45025
MLKPAKVTSGTICGQANRRPNAGTLSVKHPEDPATCKARNSNAICSPRVHHCSWEKAVTTEAAATTVTSESSHKRLSDPRRSRKALRGGPFIEIAQSSASPR